MDYKELLNDVKAGKIKPVYLLHGEESYYIDNIADYIANTILTDAEKDFNLTILYGKDATPQLVIESARRLPMFSKYNVVLLKEAHLMKEKGKEIDRLEIYLEHVSPSTVFIICYKEGKLDARKKLFKLIQQNGVVFESARLKETDIPLFIENYLKRKKIQADEKAVYLLVEYLGTDLSRITNELDKLRINISEGAKITIADIEKNIGISKDYNVYELQSALLVKNFSRSFTIVNYFNKNPKDNPLQFIIPSLHAAFSKLYLFLSGNEANQWDMFKLYGIHSSQLNDFKKAKALYKPADVENIFALMLEYDLRSKGVYNVETEPGELLKELVFKILN